MFDHGANIQSQTKFKKIPCYMCDTACRLFFVEKVKRFSNMFNIFQFSQMI